MKTSDKIGIIGMAALAFCFIGNAFYNQFVSEPRRRMSDRIDNGIVHEYLDTNNNGLYDMYRYSQEGPVIRTTIDYPGRHMEYMEEDKGRVFSVSLENELTKEECQREYRNGKIEFRTLN